MRLKILLSALSYLIAALPLSAQQLGTIDFPTSAPAAAKAPFMRGVLFLHSFEYESAAQAFREAQQVAPDFAMAYWGEAMTYTHQVWNEQDVPKARAVLARLGTSPAARRAKAGTDRERMYLDAVEALYGEGSKPRRDTLFASAIAKLAAAFPRDDEAQAFHALALLGLNQGVRDTATYKRAGAIAESVLARNQDHPGGAHYTIHAYDDPMHAAKGLYAARLYSKIAPAAPHAQHMTTHIFLALGMWDDVVSQNIIASGHDHDHWQANHYTSWLGYGYLQQGRIEDARKHLETARSNYRRTARRGEEPSLLSMRAQYIINSERWHDPALAWKLDAPNAGPVAQAMDAFATGYAAIREGKRSVAADLQGKLLLIAKSAATDDGYSANERIPGVLERELRALILFEDGKRPEALALLREASKIEDAIPMEFGPPDIVKPTHELLGELLLRMNQPAEAKAEFERALALAPGRARSLLGLGRAALAAGDTAVARKALGDLKRNWHSADAAVPEAAELKRMLARLGQ